MKKPDAHAAEHEQREKLRAEFARDWIMQATGWKFSHINRRDIQDVTRAWDAHLTGDPDVAIPGEQE